MAPPSLWISSLEALDHINHLLFAEAFEFSNPMHADFFMSEKGKASDAHYRSLMSAQYTTIGVGIAENEKQGRYYLTVHYATEIAEDTAPLCVAAR